eukprot:556002-Prorocentrum_minimum.AAC.1
MGPKEDRRTNKQNLKTLNPKSSRCAWKRSLPPRSYGNGTWPAGFTPPRRIPAGFAPALLGSHPPRWVRTRLAGFAPASLGSHPQNSVGFTSALSSSPLTVPPRP